MKKTGPGRKKIAIIRNAYSFDFGGGERMSANLAVCLIDNGLEATLVSRSQKVLSYAASQNVPAIRGWWWSRQNWSGARIALIPVYFLWQFLLFLWYLSLFLRLRPHIVHAQSKDDFIAATIAGRLLGKKVVWTDHADLKYVYQNLEVWYKNPIGKMVWLCSRFVGLIILTSQEDKKQIELASARTLPSKYRVIYDGISDKPELLGKKHGGDKIVFAATSRLVTAKGIGELIEAFRQVQSRAPSELWLLGEGPEESRFRKMASGNNSIKFLGFPSDALTRAAKADVFVHPSYLEGFSISLLEAAMMGKPIIACSVGGNPELISNGKNGILIPPRDAEALSKAMMKLATNKQLRQQYGDAIRKTFEKNFLFEKIVKEVYIPIYEKL